MESMTRTTARDSASGRLLGGKLGLGQAGAPAQPVPAVPGPDHPEVVPPGAGARVREPDQISGRPGDDEDHDNGECVVPGVSEP